MSSPRADSTGNAGERSPDAGRRAELKPGDRVRYVGQATDRDVWAIVEDRDCPEGTVALRLKNNLVFLADPKDCVTPAPLTFPMEFPR